MSRTRLLGIAAAALAATLTASAAMGQTTPPPTPPAARGQGRAGRAGLPPVGASMNQQQLQDYLDTWQLLQAKRVLQLTEEQQPNFIARLQRLQSIRRRHAMERRRIMGELNTLLNANPAARNEDIDAHVKALSDTQDALAVDLKKAYLDLDAVMTPWQRGRFRQFEDQVERQKIELLATIGPPGGKGGDPNVPGPGRGRF